MIIMYRPRLQLNEFKIYSQLENYLLLIISNSFLKK